MLEFAEETVFTYTSPPAIDTNKDKIVFDFYWDGKEDWLEYEVNDDDSFTIKVDKEQVPKKKKGKHDFGLKLQ